MRFLRKYLCALSLIAGLGFTTFWALQALSTLRPSGTWTSTASLSQPRAGSAAALLDSGDILVTGGGDAATILSSVERYGSGGVFSSAPAMTYPRRNHTITRLEDGRLFVAGGITTGGAPTATAEVYSVVTGSWSTAGGMSTARSGHTATLLEDGRVLIAGGSNGSTATATLEVFNPVSNTFSVLPATLGSARTGHAAATFPEGKVLILGGSNAGAALQTAEIFDSGTNSVSPSGSLSAARANLAASALINGKVLAAGGSNAAGELASAEVYDPATGTFGPTGAMAAPRSGHAAFLLPQNGGVLIVGGSAPNAATEIYQSWTGTFVATGSVGAPRSQSAGSALAQGEGRLLLAGGSGPLATAELYNFATVTTDKDDYAPGETVTIAGSGWQPAETVTMVLKEFPKTCTDRTLTAVADASGVISNTEFAPEEHHLGVRFFMTASGGLSGQQAYATFTDGNPQAVNLGAQSPNPLVAPGSATYNVEVVLGGNTDSCTVTLSAAATASPAWPGAATFTFSGGANPFTTTNVNFSRTLTVAVPAGTAANTYNFIVTATRGTNCQGMGNLTANGTLVVGGSPPTVTINQAALQADPTNTSPINFTVVFSQAVTSFATGDVTLSGTAGATTGTVSGSGTTYNVAVSGMTGPGTVIASIAAGVAQDGSGNLNVASTSTDNTVTYDATPPTVTINQAAGQADPTNTSPINFTVVFGETVADFATGDVTLSGTAGATTATVTGSGTTYNVAVSGMTSNGTVIASIGAGVAHDAAGNGNTVSTSTDNTVTYDATPPTVTINQAVGQADPTNTSPINFTVVFDEPVADFATGDVTLSGTAGATTATVTGSGTTYNVAVSGMTGDGTVVASVGAGVAHDAAGNGNTAATGTDNTVTYDATPPAVTINQAVGQSDPTKTSPINFTVVFSEAVTDFATGDVSLSGTAGATTATVTGSGATYNVAVSGMTSDGTVIATVGAGVAHDEAGNGNVASSSTDNTVTYDTTAPSVSILFTPDGNDGWFKTDPAAGSASATDANAVASIDCSNGMLVQGSLVGGGTPSASTSLTVSGNGSHSISCTATDSAGNMSATTMATVMIDSIAPAIARNAAADVCSVPGMNGWCRGTQTAGFTATDVSSGLAIPAQASFTQSSATQGAMVSIPSGAVCDVAGNCNAGINAGPFKIDSTVPTLTGGALPLANTFGWNNTDVTVTFACTDSVSGVAAGSPTAPVMLMAEGTNQQVPGTCSDNAGNASALVVGGINIDKTNPARPDNVLANPVSIGSGATLTAFVKDVLGGGVSSNMASAEYNINGGVDWYPMSAVSPDSFGNQTVNVSAAVPSASVSSVGLYLLCVRSKDRADNQSLLEGCALLAVYDPTAGFVTGGGWIDSLAGAYVVEPEAAGKAHFGFVSKYKKGQSIVDGNTQFQFQAANLNFHSTAHTTGSLVVNGSKAQYMGRGTINGMGDYNFLLTAIDGHQLQKSNANYGIDKFRIKIMNRNADGSDGSTVYDNKLGEAPNSDAATVLGGGSIQIHTGK